MLVSLILKNILARRARSLLTMLGISVGIAAVVTLGIVSEGMKASFEEVLKTGGADFIVGQANAADLMLSTISEERANDIEQIDGVEEAVGVLMGVIQQENIPFFMMFGIKREDLAIAEISTIQGRAFEEGRENEIILGKLASGSSTKQIGDRIDVGGKQFIVVGVFETGNIMQDSGAFAELETVQKLFRREDQVSMVFVKVASDANIAEVAQRIEDTFSNELVSIKSVAEVAKIDQGFVVMDGASVAISLLAIIIGGFGVMNTMIMSVFERTREIGVLRAVGWRRSRILRMIVGESVILSLSGFIIGAILGIGAVYGITSLPTVSTFLKFTLFSRPFLIALGVAVLLGVIGGLYPAYRASRLSPAEALRYE